MFCFSKLCFLGISECFLEQLALWVFQYDTHMSFCVQKTLWKVARHLLDAHANVDAIDENGATALHLTCALVVGEWPVTSKGWRGGSFNL